MNPAKLTPEQYAHLQESTYRLLHWRCPGCNRVPKKWGGMAIYLRNGDPRPFSYHMCSRCMDHLEGMSEQERNHFVDSKIEPAVEAFIHLSDMGRQDNDQHD